MNRKKLTGIAAAVAIVVIIVLAAALKKQAPAPEESSPAGQAAVREADPVAADSVRTGEREP